MTTTPIIFEVYNFPVFGATTLNVTTSSLWSLTISPLNNSVFRSFSSHFCVPNSHWTSFLDCEEQCYWENGILFKWSFHPHVWAIPFLMKREQCLSRFNTFFTCILNQGLLNKKKEYKALNHIGYPHTCICTESRYKLNRNITTYKDICLKNKGMFSTKWTKTNSTHLTIFILGWIFIGPWKQHVFAKIAVPGNSHGSVRCPEIV